MKEKEQRVTENGCVKHKTDPITFYKFENKTVTIQNKKKILQFQVTDGGSRNDKRNNQ